MAAGRSSWTLDRDRVGAAALSAAAVAAIGYALVAGLVVSLPVRPADVMQLFSIAAPRPPAPREKPPPPHPHHAEREGASAPPNKRSTATPVVAPTPPVPLPPSPIVAAPVPATGSDASSGAAPVAGPGTGAGGFGNGLGSGRGGNGRGSGGSPAQVISRSLRIDDLPQAVLRGALAGDERRDVVAHYTVTAQGRVTNCRVTRSSGDAALDVATCRAMTDKLRYRPELDAGGRAIAIETDGYQTWHSRYSADAEPDD